MSAKDMSKCCNNCKHFDIFRTPTGRPKKGEIGICRFRVSSILPDLKQSMLDLVPVSCRHDVASFKLHTHGVEASDGSDCPCYATKEQP